MNRSLGVLLLISLLSPGIASAEDRLNIRTNPLMALGTVVNLEVDVRLGERWALGPVLSANGTEPDYHVGLRLNRYETGTFDQGWLLSMAATGGSELGDYKVVNDVYTDERDRGWKAALGLNQAYLWRWDTFNTTVGLGARVEYHELQDRLSLHSDVHFSIGWIR
ncbi:DUF3575 domain-containing protein [Saccharospirillum salsuginis]|uniref:Outer membrane protein beta-barrel domain-containing protein n=1 Tax=Saccharospirillum salsuginis TaxID=418750 RepID=A0A918K501_9GAMM|nr:DUF3575 domain-containing protein [Saccharospirillum salsuginis]GGX49452.1 hypothetical protein GCM10007392_15960 [Saccharospirillum salsuginis]